MSFISNLISSASKDQPEAVPYTPIKGTDPTVFYTSAKNALGVALSRKDTILNEIERLQGELVKTELVIRAAGACVDVMVSAFPTTQDDLDHELDDYMKRFE
jgi:uncharacterized protein YijF (DUF1287 family)